MSLFGFFRGFFGGSGDPFSRGMTLDDEDEEDEEDVGGVFGGHHGDSFTFSFGPDGGKFDDGFSGLFQEMDELFRGFGSWEVPGRQFEFPGIDPHSDAGRSEEGGRRSLRDWMLKDPERDHPERRRDTDPVGDSDPQPRDRPSQDGPRAGPLTPYFSPWSPSNTFEELWKNLRQRDAVKEDTDLDSKVNSEGLEKILKPSEPERKSFFKSVSVSKVVLPDGSTEERRVTRDGEGNEETTVTRSHGDQSHNTVTRRDAEGKEERTERMVNLDDGESSPPPTVE
ncbi:HCLS1-associated protein X-1 isoform X2 [Mustelus asterias]